MVTTNRVWISASLLALCFVRPIRAQDTCRDILTQGFYNEYSKATSQARSRATYAQLCSSTYEQAQSLLQQAQASGESGSLGFSYGLFGLDVGGASSTSNSQRAQKFREWQSRYCSTSSYAESGRAAEFLMQKTVAESVVNAWAACMQGHQGLSCWATPHNNEVFINVSWKKESLSRAVVVSSYLSLGAVAHFKDVPQGSLLPASYQLNPGLLQVPITRNSDSQVSGNLNVVHDGVSYSCNVFVPSDNDFSVKLATPESGPGNVPGPKPNIVSLSARQVQSGERARDHR